MSCCWFALPVNAARLTRLGSRGSVRAARFARLGSRGSVSYQSVSWRLLALVELDEFRRFGMFDGLDEGW